MRVFSCEVAEDSCAHGAALAPRHASLPGGPVTCACPRVGYLFANVDALGLGLDACDAVLACMVDFTAAGWAPDATGDRRTGTHDGGAVASRPPWTLEAAWRSWLGNLEEVPHTTPVGVARLKLSSPGLLLQWLHSCGFSEIPVAVLPGLLATAFLHCGWWDPASWCRRTETKYAHWKVPGAPLAVPCPDAVHPWYCDPNAVASSLGAMAVVPSYWALVVCARAIQNRLGAILDSSGAAIGGHPILLPVVYRFLLECKHGLATVQVATVGDLLRDAGLDASLSSFFRKAALHARLFRATSGRHVDLGPLCRLDPVLPPVISAPNTDAYAWLFVAAAAAMGWPVQVLSSSTNGWHQLLLVPCPPDREAHQGPS
jgi:hypothetical protein